MIGRFLATLTEEQEDRVLVTPMVPGNIARGCLLACAAGTRDAIQAPALLRLSGAVFTAPEDSFRRRASRDFRGHASYGGLQFDLLCRRFGLRRTTAAIRNRILRNRLQRALAHVQQEVSHATI